MTPDTNLSLPANLAPAKPAGPRANVSRASVWLHRLSLVIFVMFCVEVGLLLTVLPWTRVWTDNSLLAEHAMLKSIVQDNFVRGVITGIGLVDVWIGIWEAVHYKDPGKKNL